MDLFLHLLQAIPVLIYWLSIILIGYVAIRATQEKLSIKTDSTKGITHNIFFKILFGFAAGVLLLGLISVPFYLFRLPSALYTLIYIVLLLVSLVMAIRFVWKRRFTSKTITIGGGLGYWSFLGIVVITLGLLVMDYVATTYFGAQFAEGSDSYVHVARILTISTYGFSIDDGFMRGVAESRYHFNAIYAVYVPIIKLTGIIPADAWSLSLAFFRFIQWVAIGALAFFVFDRYLIKDKRWVYVATAASIVLAIALFSSSQFMHVAVYPNKVETLWLVLFVIGLALFMDRHKKLGGLLAIASAVLITLTHPTYSLMAALFVCVLATALLAGHLVRVYKVTRHQLILLGSLFAVLMVSPVVTILFPDRMTEDSFNFGNFNTMTLFGIEILPFGLPSTLEGWILMITSVTGYVYLIFRLWMNDRRGVAIIVTCLMLFIYLIVHNPLFMAVVHEKLPLWLLARFGAMNVFQFISLILGIYAFIALCQKLIKHMFMKKAAIIIIILVATVFISAKLPVSYKNLYYATKGIDHGYLEYIHRTHTTLKNTFEPGSVVVANIGDSYFLPAVLPVKVVAIHEAHATPEADSADRLACTSQLFSTRFSDAVLRTVDADYIVIAKWENNFKELWKELDARTDVLDKIADTQDYLVYKVDETRLSGVILKESPCYDYQESEGNKPE